MGEKHLRRTLEIALEQADRARDFRGRIRRKTAPGKHRNARIDSELEALAEVMRPIRSLQGKVAFGGVPEDYVPRLRETSHRLRYEAHALRRMKR